MVLPMADCFQVDNLNMYSTEYMHWKTEQSGNDDALLIVRRPANFSGLIIRLLFNNDSLFMLDVFQFR